MFAIKFQFAIHLFQLPKYDRGSIDLGLIACGYVAAKKVDSGSVSRFVSNLLACG